LEQNNGVKRLLYIRRIKMNKLLSFKNLFSFLLAAAVLVATLGLAAPAAAQSSCGATYTVQRGDSLTKIARHCEVSYSELLKANPNITNPNRIFPGQVINIPTPGVPVTGGAPTPYTVKQGDTLFSIAQRYGLSQAELQTANPGTGASITVGQVLNIPARIRFATGGTAALLDNQLQANNRHVYLLRAEANQILEVSASEASGLSLAIRGADGSVLKSASSNLSFRGVLPKTQDYAIELVSGSSSTGYRLSTAVPARISFSAGGTSATRSGTVTNAGQFYILRASQGQTLNVSVSPQSGLLMAIKGVDGSVVLNESAAPASFSGVLPSTQDYIISLKSTGQAQNFNLAVSIPAGGAPVSGSKSHTVQRGDTLASIARHYGTTVTVLLRANPEITNANLISVGQVIYLPGATLTLSNGQVVYVVASGDTLSTIARTFNKTLSQVLAANPQITNSNLIYTGQRINIP
jgi:LysM repeat protein